MAAPPGEPDVLGAEQAMPNRIGTVEQVAAFPLAEAAAPIALLQPANLSQLGLQPLGFHSGDDASSGIVLDCAATRSINWPGVSG